MYSLLLYIFLSYYVTAQSQAGGRICSVQLEEDMCVELGAQWIHGQGNEVYKLSYENGLLSDIVSNEGEGKPSL